MIAPLILAQLCQQIYSPISAGVFDQVITNGSVTVGIKKIGDVTTLSFAGSEDSTDWIHDFTALPFDHPQLKTIHRGFWSGVEDIFAKLKPYLTGLIALAGHSLGCAHAAYVAGLCAVSLIPVQTMHLFAPPRMSYSPLSILLNAWIDDIKAYRNGSDPVPGVPLNLPFAPWVPIAKLIMIDAPPANKANIFGYHSCALYVKGLTP